MKTAHIVYANYYNIENEKISIGGIQTYITNLIPLLAHHNYKVIIHQGSCKNFSIYINGATIKGYKCNSTNIYQRASLIHKILCRNIGDDDIVIFATDTMAKNIKNHYSIAIQHGIAWDKPIDFNDSRLKSFLYYWARNIRSYQMIKRADLVDEVVCVDYNYVNWYRALTAKKTDGLRVIPNFAKIENNINRRDESIIKIIFARRFYEYRGTRIFAEAIKKIVKKYNNVFVTIAGEGPDEEYLTEELKGYNSINITKYSSEESFKIHSEHDIAVIPTLGSEGTSLSLIEAMAAGCAVLCTNVGGMTNVVIDHYNGMIIQPQAEEVYNKMDILISDSELRKKLGTRAIDTIKNGFSYDLWKDRWDELLDMIG